MLLVEQYIHRSMKWNRELRNMPNWFFKTFYFVLEYSQLAMLWWFQVNSEGTQPYVFMYPFSPKLPSHPVCHITLSQLIFDKSEIAVQWRKKNLVKKMALKELTSSGGKKESLNGWWIKCKYKTFREKRENL